MPTTLKISKIKRAVTCAGNSNTRRKVAGKRIARELEGEPIATKKSKKCGCGAMVYGSLTCNGKWELKKVCLEHSHTHSPSKSMIVTEYRLEELEKVSYIRRTLHFGNVVGFPNAKLHRRVFLTWLDAVGGSPPMAILTDQDSTMRKALEVVMPQTRHGWCLWHITEKFSVKLGKCKGYLDFKEELSDMDETMHIVIEGLKELEMKVKEKTTPALPISNVGKTGNRITPPSVNKKKCVGPSRQTPSSVARSVVYEAVGVESDECNPPLIEPNPVSIKDPPRKRGPGCVQSSRFMITVEEDRRRKSGGKNMQLKRLERSMRERRLQRKKTLMKVFNLRSLHIPLQTPLSDTVGNDIMDMPSPSFVPPNQFVGVDVDMEGYEDDVNATSILPPIFEDDFIRRHGLE
uniref:MULE transposase domain-containing protein n=1 Tax=Chenopodium quinoa TaxID=63459 RepID=A0A803NA34_CHEQI